MREPAEPGGKVSEITLPRAWYVASIADFLTADPSAVLGQLVRHSTTHSVEADQIGAWRAELEIVRRALAGWDGTLALEFEIPRLGRRLDAVVISASAIIVLEFKSAASPTRADRDQVWDYALDLKYFHAASHAAAVFPVLVHSGEPGLPEWQCGHDDVYRPRMVTAAQLRSVLESAVQCARPGVALEPAAWALAPYRPTPTILEAARALYARHTVHEITRNDAGAANLSRTTARVEALVAQAQHENRKLICFVTGVPGAGKTLAGLNLATQHRRRDEPTHAVFLSGNDPLVAVLREALVRDEFGRRQAEGGHPRKGEIRSEVQPFIQPVRHFRDDGFKDPAPPHEHVAIFDEAQRAWTQKRLSDWLARRRNLTGFQHSEPEVLIERLDRHRDWAVVVCLVGGGQEINTGEAGISSWLDALDRGFRHWQVHISPQLRDSEYDAGHAVERAQRRGAIFDDALHLSVSMRSFRAERLSRFVKLLLDLDTAGARAELAAIQDRYPVAITRNLDRARAWLRAQARGTERFGLLASSKALRLKPHAIDVRVAVEPVRWFLDGPQDTRSSLYLEDAASEFDVQGLELDWVCVTWDGDLSLRDGGWNYRDFHGKQWKQVHQPERRQYLKNAYRVLLTRARQGMVIFVPPGSSDDATRIPAMYDTTFQYLRSLGIQELV